MTVAPREPATIWNTATVTAAASSSPTAVDGECVAGDKKAFGGGDENVVALQNTSDTDSSSIADDNEEDDQQHHHHHRVMIQEEPLKYKRDSPATVVGTPDSKRRKRIHEDGDKKKRHCEFNETVKVVPIPMRTEYSSYVRQRLWSNSMEIQQNAARNTLEFASEGWNWRSVILDESMYICDKTGELIHPIHYEPYSLVVALDDNNHDSSATSCATTVEETTAGVATATTETATQSITDPLPPTEDTTS